MKKKKMMRTRMRMMIRWVRRKMRRRKRVMKMEKKEEKEAEVAAVIILLIIILTRVYCHRRLLSPSATVVRYRRSAPLWAVRPLWACPVSLRLG
jgi:hypothetical protein